jgi:hypothetical protein
MRYFNTAGPVRPDDHYYLPPLERFVLDEILLLIQQKKYFVLHAPRQTGKTSALLALMECWSMRWLMRPAAGSYQAAIAASRLLRRLLNKLKKI